MIYDRRKMARFSLNNKKRKFLAQYYRYDKKKGDGRSKRGRKKMKIEKVLNGT